MVPETHEIEFPSTDELRKFLVSDEFRNDVAQKLKDQYVVEVAVHEPHQEKQGSTEVTLEKMVLSYTRNNAGGLKDAIDFLLLPFISRGLDFNTVKGAIPRPKSDSFEDNMPYFESKLLQRAEPAISTESPTRGNFNDENGSRSIFDKLRKPGSMSSFSSFIERRRKNGSQSPSLFMHASNNASKASLVSMESRDSGYRNPWNDSGIDLEGETSVHSNHGNGWGSFGTSVTRPSTSSNSLSGAFESKFPFGSNPNVSSSSLNTPMIPGLGMMNGTNGGDVTPRYDAQARSIDGDNKERQAADAAPMAPTPTIIRPASSTSLPGLSTLSAGGANHVRTTPSPLATTTSATPPPPSTSTKVDDTNTNDPSAASGSGSSSSSGYPAPIGPPR